MRHSKKKQTVTEEFKKIKGLKTKVIFTLVTIVIVAILLILCITLLGAKADKIIAAYNAIGGKPTDSKYNFASKHIVLTYDEKGQLSIKFVMQGSGYDSTVTVPDTGSPGTSNDEDESGNGGGSGGSGGTADFDADMYNLLLSHGVGSDKAKTLSIIYKTLGNAGYDLNVVLGMMGCSACEGNIDSVEYTFSKYGSSFGFNMPSGTSGKIQTWADIQYLMNWDASSKEKVTGTDGSKVQKGSCGVGAAQWSFGRRITFLKLLPSGKNPTYDDFAQATANMYLTELSGSYSKVVSGCKGKNAYDSGYYCAVNYEMGGKDWSGAKDRANWSKNIYEWMEAAGMIN